MCNKIIHHATNYNSHCTGHIVQGRTMWSTRSPSPTSIKFKLFPWTCCYSALWCTTGKAVQEAISLPNSSLTANDSTATQNDWDEYISEENNFSCCGYESCFLIICSHRVWNEIVVVLKKLYNCQTTGKQWESENSKIGDDQKAGRHLTKFRKNIVTNPTQLEMKGLSLIQYIQTAGTLCNGYSNKGVCTFMCAV